MTDRAPVFTGGCQCGAIRYSAYADPIDVTLCHCRMCQKAAGGPFEAFVVVAPGDFAWTRGTPARFNSSTIAIREFCSACGTPLSIRGPGTEVELTYGSLDAPGRYAPSVQDGIEGRYAWVQEIAKLPGRITEDDMPAEALRALVNHQHPDHDTPEGWTPE